MTSSLVLMITIPGTLMQNRRVLKLYRHIYRCVGLEMEATINKARAMGIASPSECLIFNVVYMSNWLNGLVMQNNYLGK